MAIDYISVPSSTDWEWSGDFTIEAFSNTQPDLINAISPTILSRTDSSSSYMYFTANESSTAAMRFRDYDGGGDTSYPINITTEPITILDNTTYHFAVSRTSNVYRLFLNGIAQPISGEGGATTKTVTNAFVSRSSQLEIGRLAANANYYVNGWIDELRISNISRYTSDFTPPTTDFSDDGNTLLLLKFDGTDGETTTTDSSSYGRTVTFYNSAELDTDIKKFGASSLRLNFVEPAGTGRFFQLFQ